MLLPFAGELEGALADWLGEGLVRRDGGEPFARGLALGSQTVDQTQGLTLRSQFRSPRSRAARPPETRFKSSNFRERKLASLPPTGRIEFQSHSPPIAEGFANQFGRSRLCHISHKSPSPRVGRDGIYQ